MTLRFDDTHYDSNACLTIRYDYNDVSDMYLTNMPSLTPANTLFAVMKSFQQNVDVRNLHCALASPSKLGDAQGVTFH
jgi:predicted short-subunit dehydrogenase-like oxidoreductase (DUF2520 family)